MSAGPDTQASPAGDGGYGPTRGASKRFKCPRCTVNLTEIALLLLLVRYFVVLYTPCCIICTKTIQQTAGGSHITHTVHEFHRPRDIYFLSYITEM